MDISLEAIQASLPALGRRVLEQPAEEPERFIPTDVETSIEQRPNDRFVARIEVSLYETTTPWNRSANFHYGILPNGEVNLLTSIGLSDSWGWYIRDVYSPPVYEWAASLRTQARSRAIHEELVAAVWRPERVAALLERGGWDLVDSMA